MRFCYRNESLAISVFFLQPFSCVCFKLKNNSFSPFCHIVKAFLLPFNLPFNSHQPFSSNFHFDVLLQNNFFLLRNNFSVFWKLFVVWGFIWTSLSETEKGTFLSLSWAWVVVFLGNDPFKLPAILQSRQKFITITTKPLFFFVAKGSRNLSSNWITAEEKLA